MFVYLFKYLFCCVIYFIQSTEGELKAGWRKLCIDGFQDPCSAMWYWNQADWDNREVYHEQREARKRKEFQSEILKGREHL
jgi:hypothetical protein